ncbi:MAG: hypothetical protein KGH75_04480 [Rhodospirillales bacterium]|nr:hypothetical protein [Rhodospirillales bacterium]
MSPLATAVEKQGLAAEFGAVVPSGVPATHTIGLLTAATWQASHTYALGNYVIPVTDFAGRAPATLGRVFKCTTAGTSAAAEPTWPSTAAGTVTDGTVVWTEISTEMATGTVTAVGSLEQAGSGYSRPTVVNNGTNWVLQTGGDPASVLNLADLAFGTTTAAWEQIIGGVVYDAVPTNVRAWGLLDTPSTVAAGVGVAVIVPAGQFAVTLV